MSYKMRCSRETLASAAVAVTDAVACATAVTAAIITIAVATAAVAAIAAIAVAFLTVVGSGPVVVFVGSVTAVALAIGSRYPRRAEGVTTGTGKHSLRSCRSIVGASRLLPAHARDEYQEEWTAWMLDLRAAGTPRARRWTELLTIILIAAPRLAIILRTAARRAVDR
ncbi:hypothetical protein FHS29_007064 [Saccharothrix tamanrassetensis]|uniref:Uncharacterized protein n=1 Tax=Saccharothrix tamanrassetensis TaxID=1051531 RepID=A0A841CT38_9PSEU|nr:hypothetical protein [Saccharothrix tamanrassetensis]MBB5960440.1 hypothetical protein [Saccharothrix tamanrassetensis]